MLYPVAFAAVAAGASIYVQNDRDMDAVLQCHGSSTSHLIGRFETFKIVNDVSDSDPTPSSTTLVNLSECNKFDVVFASSDLSGDDREQSVAFDLKQDGNYSFIPWGNFGVRMTSNKRRRSIKAEQGRVAEGTGVMGGKELYSEDSDFDVTFIINEDDPMGRNRLGLVRTSEYDPWIWEGDYTTIVGLSIIDESQYVDNELELELWKFKDELTTQLFSGTVPTTIVHSAKNPTHEIEFTNNTGYADEGAIFRYINVQNDAVVELSYYHLNNDYQCAKQYNDGQFDVITKVSYNTRLSELQCHYSIGALNSGHVTSEPTQPAELTDSTVETESTNLTDATDSNVDTESTNLTDATDSTVDTESTNLTDATDSTVNTESTNLTDATDSTVDTESTNLTDATDSTVDTESTNLTDATHSTVDTDSTNLTDATDSIDTTTAASPGLNDTTIWAIINITDPTGLTLTSEHLSFVDNYYKTVPPAVVRSIFDDDYLDYRTEAYSKTDSLGLEYVYTSLSVDDEDIVMSAELHRDSGAATASLSCGVWYECYYKETLVSSYIYEVQFWITILDTPKDTTTGATNATDSTELTNATDSTDLTDDTDSTDLTDATDSNSTSATSEVTETSPPVIPGKDYITQVFLIVLDDNQSQLDYVQPVEGTYWSHYPSNYIYSDNESEATLFKSMNYGSTSSGFETTYVRDGEVVISYSAINSRTSTATSDILECGESYVCEITQHDVTSKMLSVSITLSHKDLTTSTPPPQQIQYASVLNFMVKDMYHFDLVNSSLSDAIWIQEPPGLLEGSPNGYKTNIVSAGASDLPVSFSLTYSPRFPGAVNALTASIMYEESTQKHMVTCDNAYYTCVMREESLSEVDGVQTYTVTLNIDPVLIPSPNGDSYYTDAIVKYSDHNGSRLVSQELPIGVQYKIVPSANMVTLEEQTTTTYYFTTYGETNAGYQVNYVAHDSDKSDKSDISLIAQHYEGFSGSDIQCGENYKCNVESGKMTDDRRYQVIYTVNWVGQEGTGSATDSGSTEPTGSEITDSGTSNTSGTDSTEMTVQPPGSTTTTAPPTEGSEPWILTEVSIIDTTGVKLLSENLWFEQNYYHLAPVSLMSSKSDTESEMFTSNAYSMSDAVGLTYVYVPINEDKNDEPIVLTAMFDKQSGVYEATIRCGLWYDCNVMEKSRVGDDVTVKYSVVVRDEPREPIRKVNVDFVVRTIDGSPIVLSSSSIEGAAFTDAPPAAISHFGSFSLEGDSPVASVSYVSSVNEVAEEGTINLETSFTEHDIAGSANVNCGPLYTCLIGAEETMGNNYYVQVVISERSDNSVQLYLNLNYDTELNETLSVGVSDVSGGTLVSPLRDLNAPKDSLSTAIVSSTPIGDVSNVNINSSVAIEVMGHKCTLTAAMLGVDIERMDVLGEQTCVGSDEESVIRVSISEVIANGRVGYISFNIMLRGSDTECILPHTAATGYVFHPITDSSSGQCHQVPVECVGNIVSVFGDDMMSVSQGFKLFRDDDCDETFGNPAGANWRSARSFIRQSDRVGGILCTN